MIAVYDIDKSLRPFLKKKITENSLSVYEINSMDELLDIISTRLNEYEKIFINTNGMTLDEIEYTFIPILKSPLDQAKVVIYEFTGTIPYVINTKLFNNFKNSQKPTDNTNKEIKKTGRRSKYEHILIGISTGGPSTLEMVIPQFPEDIPVSIVVIQHMLRGDHINRLCDRLDKISRIHVKVAEDGEVLKKGVAYFPPPGYHLYYRRMPNGEVSIHLNPEYLKRGTSTIFKEDKKFVHVPSVDIGLESATEVFGDKLVAAILTGMGTDGAIALKYARDNGAHTLSQDESTSIIYGMPKAAFEQGGSMEVLKHYLIPNRMLEIIKY